MLQAKRAPSATRARRGPRIQLACIHCKDRKLRCDEQIPSCSNCQRFDLVCLVEDPTTKRQLPRDYVQSLEQRIAHLEGLLGEAHPDIASDHLERNQALNTLNSTADQVEDANDLAHRVGMLTLHAAGDEPRYLGSSSLFAFSRVINSSLRQVVAKKTLLSLNDPSYDFLLPTTCEMPSYEVAVTLSNAYFDNIHLQYPFLHEPTFRSWEAALVRDSQDVSNPGTDLRPLFLLNMVYAVGALLRPELGYAPDQLYMTAQLYADCIFTADNLMSIQAILCCAAYSLRSSVGTGHWKLAGIALRQCIDLGYHRDQTHFTQHKGSLQVEMCKRAFWCVYIMDSTAAVMLGRPLGLRYQETDVEYPLDVDDEFLFDSGTCVSPRTSDFQPQTQMTKAIHGFQLRRLWAIIHSDLYSSIGANTMPRQDQDQKVRELRVELDKWRASCPLMENIPSEPRTLFTSSSWYDLNYNYTILHLYRAQITSHSPSPPKDVLLECLQAASEICRGYRCQFSKRTMSFTWGALHELFAAGLTYLHCLWISADARASTRPDHASSVCTDVTIILVIMSERWEYTVPYRDIFETLASRTVTMLVDCQARESTSSMNLPDNAEEADLSTADAEWTRLMASVSDEQMFAGFGNPFMDSISQWAGGIER